MKTEIKIVFLAVAAMVGGWANLAVAIPVANQQGDYPVPPPRQRGNRQVNWLVVDTEGKPWLPIATDNGNCFVRANKRFIKPIRENPTTLKPLE